MTDTRKNLNEIWENIGFIKANLRIIERALQDEIMDSQAIDLQYGSTPTAVPSTQACSSTVPTAVPTRSLNNPPPECFAPSTQACNGE